MFGSYAALFSTSSARRIYAAIRRWLEGCLAVLFGIAGVRLLTSHPLIYRHFKPGHASNDGEHEVGL